MISSREALPSAKVLDVARVGPSCSKHSCEVCSILGKLSSVELPGRATRNTKDPRPNLSCFCLANVCEAPTPPPGQCLATHTQQLPSAKVLDFARVGPSCSKHSCEVCSILGLHLHALGAASAVAGKLPLLLLGALLQALQESGGWSHFPVAFLEYYYVL